MSANFRIVFGNPVQLISIVGRISLFAEFLGLGYFFPLLLFRYFGVQVAAAAPLYGVVVVTSIGGSLLGGWLNGSLEQRYGSARHCLLAGLCLCAMGASYFVGLLIGTLASVVVASWVMGLFMGAAYPALGALVGEIQPSERRTFGFAAQIAPAFFIGGFAPLVIGAMSDAFGSLWAASALFTALISLIGVVVLFSSRLVNPTPS